MPLKYIENKRAAVFIHIFIETEGFFHCQHNSSIVDHILQDIQRKVKKREPFKVDYELVINIDQPFRS